MSYQFNRLKFLILYRELHNIAEVLVIGDLGCILNWEIGSHQAPKLHSRRNDESDIRKMWFEESIYLLYKDMY